MLEVKPSDAVRRDNRHVSARGTFPRVTRRDAVVHAILLIVVRDLLGAPSG